MQKIRWKRWLIKLLWCTGKNAMRWRWRMAIRERINNNRKDFFLGCTHTLDTCDMYATGTGCLNLKPKEVFSYKRNTWKYCPQHWSHISHLRRQARRHESTELTIERTQQSPRSGMRNGKNALINIFEKGRKLWREKQPWAQVNVICFPCHFSIYPIPAGNFWRGRYIILSWNIWIPSCSVTSSQIAENNFDYYFRFYPRYVRDGTRSARRAAAANEKFTYCIFPNISINI